MSAIDDARKEYRDFMSRMDVAFAFGHPCSIGTSPEARALRAEADRLLTRLKTLQVLSGERPLNRPGTIIDLDQSSN